MSGSLADLKPSSIWRHFEQLLKIPRCSGNEGSAADYVVSQAKRLGLSWTKDQAGNVIVRKPARQGRERAETIVVQAHLDMVCEKNSDVRHDFFRDPIEAEIRDGWVRAKGTTLGADNGIGVASALALMEETSVVHGPLEFLFTVDEETGLTGARSVQPGSLNGKYLINVDSEEEGTYTIGCAGGADSEITIPLARKKPRIKTAYELKIAGLRGGHSGLDINQGRANALKLLARILVRAASRFPLELVRIEGGNKRNAIPREGRAVFLLDSTEADAFRAFLRTAGEEIRAEYGSVEKDLEFSLCELNRREEPLSARSQRILTDFLLACPHGVLRMHPDIPGLVESSTNLAIIHCTRTRAEIVCNSRSSVGPALDASRQAIKSLADLAGASIRQPEGYPGWAPNLQSPLLDKLKKVYRRIFGKEVEVVAVHAGLECGLFGEKFPGLDMISVGPTIKHPHSPDEAAEIKSVENFWTLLTTALQELAVP
jgi:dipeptidase D